MARKARVLRDFRTMHPKDKTDFGDDVIAGFTDHPLVFDTPPHDPAAMTVVNNLLKSKNTAADTGDQASIEARDEYLPTWNAMFDENGDYVDLKAKGSKVIIAQGGYHCTITEIDASTEPDQRVPDITTNKGTGSIRIITSTENQPKFYANVAVMGEEAENMKLEKDGNQLLIKNGGNDLIAVVQVVTQHESNMTNLPSDRKAKFFVVAGNAAGISQLSNPITLRIP